MVCRRTAQDRISETVFRKFAVEKSETLFRLFEKESPFTLPWSHYLQLMRIKDENERKFYEKMKLLLKESFELVVGQLRMPISDFTGISKYKN